MLDLVDKKIPGIILKFGGHAMAAGLSLKETDFKRFSDALNDILAEQVDEAILTNVLLSDGQLTGQQISLEQANELREAGPWGQAFPAPLFDGEFTILQQRLVGEKHLKMVLELEGKSVDAIAFNVDLKIWPNPMIKTVHCAYRLDVNEFRGNRTVQLLVELLRVQDKALT